MKSTPPAGRSAAFLAILAIALPVVPLVASLPPAPLIFGVLNDFAHAIVFGVLAVVILELLGRSTAWRAWIRYLLAFAGSLAAGGAVEMIQPVLGRSAELADLRTDALGAVAGLAIVAFFLLQRRWTSGVVLVIAAGVVLWPVAEASLAYWERSRQFPTLLEGFSPLDSYFIGTAGFETHADALPERWRRSQDLPSLRLRAVDSGPSLMLTEPSPDWTGYSRLMVDLTNPDSRPVTLTLRVHDRVHDNQATDRFNKRFSLAGGTRAVFAFPLAEVAESPVSRKMDLSSIAGLIIFGGNDPDLAGRELYVTRIWLE